MIIRAEYFPTCYITYILTIYAISIFPVSRYISIMVIQLCHVMPNTVQTLKLS